MNDRPTGTLGHIMPASVSESIDYSEQERELEIAEEVVPTP
jgi:hypothetical protein